MKQTKVNGLLRCTSLSYKSPAKHQRNGTLFFRKIFLKARTDLRNSAVKYPLYLTDSPLNISTFVGAERTASHPDRLTAVANGQAREPV